MTGKIHAPGTTVLHYVHSGLNRPPEVDGITIAKLCQRFLDAKQTRVASNELVESIYRDNEISWRLIVRCLQPRMVVAGLAPPDFCHLRETWSAGYEIHHIERPLTVARMVLKFGWSHSLQKSPIELCDKSSARTKIALTLSICRRLPSVAFSEIGFNEVGTRRTPFFLGSASVHGRTHAATLGRRPIHPSWPISISWIVLCNFATGT